MILLQTVIITSKATSCSIWPGRNLDVIDLGAERMRFTYHAINKYIGGEAIIHCEVIIDCRCSILVTY